MIERPEQPEPFLRGCLWPAGGGMVYPRCDPGPQGTRLPADTRAMATLPVGVRLEFLGDADEIEIAYRAETDDLGYRGSGAGTAFVLYRGGRPVSSAEAKRGEGRVRLPAGAGPDRAIVYLPEGMKPSVLELRAIGGEITPAPAEPRWLCYGDSIVEGWVASGPPNAWPHRVGRNEGLDVVNLGYAGAARGEVASAEDIAGHGAAAITIAYGTNCWTRTPHSGATLRAGLDAFLEIVRAGHPQTPIVAVSPILRADAEATPNKLGASLADLRGAFEDGIRARVAGGDRRLMLVPGRDLVAPEDFPDGIHPGDAGHAAMAAAIGPAIRVAAQGMGETDA